MPLDALGSEHGGCLPGQVAVQALVWTLWPSQAEPPFRGAGLVQLRLLFCQPRPHTALHADHVAHVDHPPFTAQPAERPIQQSARATPVTLPALHQLILTPIRLLINVLCKILRMYIKRGENIRIFFIFFPLVVGTNMNIV